MGPNSIRNLVAEVAVHDGTKRTIKTITDAVVLQEDLPHHPLAAPVALEEEDLQQCPAKK
jgi:hypothetical protein